MDNTGRIVITNTDYNTGNFFLSMNAKREVSYKVKNAPGYLTRRHPVSR